MKRDQIEKLSRLSDVFAQSAVFYRFAPWQGEKQTPSWFFHLLLDGIGFMPGIGEIADLANAIWYCQEGKIFDASLSVVSMLPGVGDVIAKSGRLNAEAIKQLAGYRDEIASLFDAIERTRPTLGSEEAKDPRLVQLHRYFMDLKKYTGQMKAALYSRLEEES